MSTVRGSAWSITINNPTRSDDENIDLARQRSGWQVIGQKEEGENGTPHYQLMLKTPQIRFSAVKKAFPRAHIELARNADALEEYVQKEETRTGELTISDKYPSMSRAYTMWYEWVESSQYRKGGWVNLTPDGYLEAFDSFASQAIMDGYYIETMAVNPQVRSAIKKFGYSILVRESNKLNLTSIDRQTDRQTGENNVEVDSTNASEDDESSTSQDVESEESEDL